jgi:hypothetical protein
MKTILSFLILAASPLFGIEPAMKALIDDSPVIVVAEPVFEQGLPPMGIGSEGVLVKYSVKFRVQKVFKADRTIRPGDVIFTRLAVFAEFPDDRTFELKEGRSKILFLRKTEYEKDSFENTSIWFGVMPHTKQREMLLGFETKEATDKKPK